MMRYLSSIHYLFFSFVFSLDSEIAMPQYHHRIESILLHLSLNG